MERYKQAKEIRKKYPRRLTNTHINAILEEWQNSNFFKPDPQDYMFSFSCSPRTDGKMNMSELKLWFLTEIRFHIHQLLEYNFEEKSSAIQKMQGCIIMSWCKHIFDGGEDEKKTQNLRIRMLKKLLSAWKETSLWYNEQKKGVQEVIDIHNRVEKEMIERYPKYKKHLDSKSFEHKCYNIVQEFINE